MLKIDQSWTSNTETTFIKNIELILQLPDSILPKEVKAIFLQKLFQLNTCQQSFIAAHFNEDHSSLYIKGQIDDYIIIGLKDYIANHTQFYDFLNRGGKIAAIYNYTSPTRLQTEKTAVVSYRSIIQAVEDLRAQNYGADKLLNEIKEKLENSIFY